MKFKLLPCVLVSLAVGLSGMQAQVTDAAKTGTSSNATSETAAGRGPSTAGLTRGDSPSSTTGMGNTSSSKPMKKSSKGKKKSKKKAKKSTKMKSGKQQTSNVKNNATTNAGSVPNTPVQPAGR